MEIHNIVITNNKYHRLPPEIYFLDISIECLMEAHA